MKNYFFIIALSLSALLLSCHKPAGTDTTIADTTQVAETMLPTEQTSPEQILVQAKQRYADQPQMMALITEAERKMAASQEPTRGAQGDGAFYETHGRVLAHSNDQYQINLEAEIVFEVAVIGDGDTDLELYVYDPEGKQVVTEDTYQSVNCYMRFTPTVSGTYTLKIVNTGAVYNNYVLLTN